jgi:hypothetical protein
MTPNCRFHFQWRVIPSQWRVNPIPVTRDSFQWRVIFIHTWIMDTAGTWSWAHHFPSVQCKVVSHQWVTLHLRTASLLIAEVFKKWRVTCHTRRNHDLCWEKFCITLAFPLRTVSRFMECLHLFWVPDKALLPAPNKTNQRQCSSFLFSTQNKVS